MKLLPLSLALVVFAPAVKAQNALDPAELQKNLTGAASLSDATKADRFDLLLTADYLHFEYVVYLDDAEMAPRETKELAALKADLEAVDAVLFPSIDTSYEDLVTKASADFKKLYDKDQEIQTELKN